TPLLISHLTLRDIKNSSQFSIRFIDRVSVKNKAISVYEVYGFESAESIKKKNMTKDQLKKAWEHYNSQQYNEAEILYQKCLEQCPDDTVAQKFIERCSDQKLLN
ncbi:MAG: adenylate cyclase, partial [Proteobacteria bacterium]|nr:adenylate cyclase [Pseudomonadota bacterium]